LASQVTWLGAKLLAASRLDPIQVPCILGTMADADDKAILDLTIEVGHLETLERAAEAQWRAARIQKDKKFAELLSLTRGGKTSTAGNGTSSATKTPKLSPKSQPTKAKVLDFINAHPTKEYTTGEIATQVGVPANSISVYLGELYRDSLISRVAMGRYRAKQGG